MSRGPLLIVLLFGCFNKGVCDFVAEAGPMYGFLGKTLYIPCVVHEEAAIAQWEVHPSLTTIGDSLSGIYSVYQDRYRLETCSEMCRNFTIQIIEVGINEPQLRCAVQYSSGVIEESSFSDITVVAPPYGDPTCSMESSTVNLGDDVKLTCNSKGGIPAAELKWKTEGRSTVLHPGPGTLGPTDSNHRESRNLQLSFTAKKEHNGKTYTCTSENTATALLFERGELPAAHMSCSTGPLTLNHPPEQTKIGPADPYIVIEGESAVITCKASEGSPDVYEYKYRQHEESWSGWTSTDEKTYGEIDRSQAGEYKCQARNLAGKDGEKALDVQIHYPPENIKISASGHEIGDDYTIIKGESLVLDCEATASNPTATYKWTKTGNTVQNMPQLLINNIQQTATGIYTCTATNMMTPTDTANRPGTGTKSVEVTVQYKPGPATTPHNSLTVTEDNSVTLECQVDVKGVPPATFTWMKGSQHLTTSDSTGQYTINSAEVKDDDGQYQCVPTNKVGSGLAANITVVVETVPTVKTRPQDTMVVNTDSNLEMKCSFEARPAVTIKWKYSNGTDLPVGMFEFKKVETTSGHADKYTTTESTLTWNLQSDPLGRRHFGGQIKCTADNSVGSAVASNTVELDVQYAPDIQLTDPIDLKKGVTKGEVVSLYVEAIANPRPANMYKWQIVKSGSSEDIPKAGYVFENIDQGSKLTIENITIEQFANYSLVATNDHGSSSVVFEVTGSDKPNKPTDFNLTATAVSLFAEWNRGWNGGLDQVFILEYLETQDEIEDLVKRTYHSVKLDQDDGIVESRQYTVSLYAKNSKGQSDSISKAISTKAKPTVNSKETVIKHDKQAREATITWSISAHSFTLIVVKVCSLNEDCRSHNITDTTQPTTVTVPDGDELSFSFFFYDGSELVSKQSDFIQIAPAKPKNDFALIIGAVIGAIVVLALIIGILVFLIWRKRNGKDNDDKTSGKREQKRSGFFGKKLERFRVAGERKKTTIYERTNPTYVNEHMSEPEYAQLSPGNKSEHTEIVYEEVDPKNRECTLDAVELGSVVHEGVFFKELNGTLQKLSGFRRGTRVIVKLPREEASVFEQSMLVADIKALKVVGQHANVVHLLAQSIHKEPIMAILACEENGDLRNYFQRMKDKLSVDVRKQYILTKMIQDVINGMDYLAQLEMRILHHRVSADHVLVSREGLCRVSGFGFVNDVLEREEYERSQGIEEAVPWMAPEQIKHYEHTRMSDVWSCGVLMWEVFNYGAEPYSDMTINEARQCIVSGGMLGCPEDASDNIYDLMRKCWETSPGRRPELSSLMRMFNRQTA